MQAWADRLQPLTTKGKGKGMWATPTWTAQVKGKGKSKGYQGVCFACGVIGHKAAECPHPTDEFIEAVKKAAAAKILVTILTRRALLPRCNFGCR